MLEINRLIKKLSILSIMLLLFMITWNLLAFLYPQSVIYIPPVAQKVNAVQIKIPDDPNSIMCASSDVSKWTNGTKRFNDIIIDVSNNLDQDSCLLSINQSNGQLTMVIISEKQQVVNLDQNFADVIKKHHINITKGDQNGEYQTFILQK